MTIDEAIDLIEAGFNGMIELHGDTMTGDEQKAFDVLKQHLATSPRMMLGSKVPDEQLNAFWWIPTRHICSRLVRRPGETWALTDGIWCDDIEVYGPLPTGGAQ